MKVTCTLHVSIHMYKCCVVVCYLIKEDDRRLVHNINTN
jgi:hypothetical protein